MDWRCFRFWFVFLFFCLQISFCLILSSGFSHLCTRHTNNQCFVVSNVLSKFGYNCWCNVYYLGPLFLTKLWHCQKTFGFFDSSEETLKEKLGLKWVNLYCNCIIRKQKKGRKIYKILFEECVAATLNRIIFITFESKAKNKKNKNS